MTTPIVELEAHRKPLHCGVVCLDAWTPARVPKDWLRASSARCAMSRLDMFSIILMICLLADLEARSKSFGPSKLAHLCINDSFC